MPGACVTIPLAEEPDRQMTLNKKTLKPLLGAHMSIAGGTPLAVQRAQRVQANVMQIFVKNNNRWEGRDLTDEEVRRFRAACRDAGLRAVVAHNAYLINLASPDEQLWRRSIRAMIDELERCRRLGLSHLVSHPGAHVGSGEGRGIRRAAQALERIADALPDHPVKIALETTAGQGTCLGHRFEHLRDILAACGARDRLAICLDTCHVFAAGYDFRTEDSYRNMMREFDLELGTDRLQVIHCNDSKCELGGRVDRHAHIGDGHIGAAGFGWLLRDPRLASVPKILETPKGKDQKEDRRNLRTLRRLSRNGAAALA